MVRALKKQPETKVPTTILRFPAVNTQQQMGNMNWVCTLGGCNKRFVREADLKRHQTTAMAHRSESELICCPQCDSTFTRTDALKRHQRSRHHHGPSENASSSNNGSIDGDEGSASSTPESRSMSPGQSEGSRRASETEFIPVTTVMTQPEAPGRPTGTQSYYPPDMVNAVFLPSRVPKGKIIQQDTWMPGLPLPSTSFQSWASGSWTVDSNKANQPLTMGTLPYYQLLPYDLFASGAAMTSEQITPVMLPESDVSNRKDDTITSLLEQHMGYDTSIDPSLPGCSGSATGAGEERAHPGTRKDREADAFVGGDLGPAIRKALKAVLEFDTGGELPLEEDLHKDRSNDSEPLPLPEGIRELINEDSLSYAPPS